MSQADEASEGEAAAIAPTDRINELNAIDKDLAQLPFHLSKAMALMANRSRDSTPNLEAVQEEFTQHCRSYFTLLSAIEVRARRQVYALDEAGRLAPGTKNDERLAAIMNDDKTSQRSGGGPLDTSWLNARAHDSVGQGLKREILDEAIEFLKRNGIERQKSINPNGENMQIDGNE